MFIIEVIKVYLCGMPEENNRYPMEGMDTCLRLASMPRKDVAHLFKGGCRVLLLEN